MLCAAVPFRLSLSMRKMLPGGTSGANGVHVISGPTEAEPMLVVVIRPT